MKVKNDLWTNDVSEEIEYLIDNNLLFEPIQIHTCAIPKEHIIQYKLKNKFSLNELVNNTFNRYLDDLEEQKRIYNLDKNSNPFYSEERYKNNLSKNTIEKLKSKYLNSNLHHLEQIITIKKPILEYLYTFLVAINSSEYIKTNQLNKSHKFTLKNFDTKTENIKNDAKKNFDESTYEDAKLHKKLIQAYKENEIQGSLIIASLTNKIVNKLLNINELDDFSKKDLNKIKRNENFNKLFEKSNFTYDEMINGYSQACYFNYAQATFKIYKNHRKEYNKKRTSTIPYIRKDIIEKDLIQLFNTALNKEVIRQIRQNKKAPNLLKIYDEINIYVVRDISDLEKEFFEFVKNEFFNETEKLKNFARDNEEIVFNISKQIRHLFY